MKPLIILTLSLAAVASSGALAQDKTRAQVEQELVQAQQNGLDYVTDTSYPDVNPIFAAQVERLKQQHSARQSSGNTVAGNGRSADESN